MRFDSSGLFTYYNDYKYYGRSVRCVAEPVNYMQDFTCSGSGLSTGQQVTLVDRRDNHNYTVKKLPDGKCWMTQNLTLGDSDSTSAQRTLTSTYTNIDNSTTYYLPPAGKQGSITSSSTLTATASANFGTSNDSYAKTQFRTKSSSYTNDSDTGYYNFYTATLGYSYYGSVSSGSSTRDICPKGWRLPKVTDGGSTVTSGRVAEFTALAKSYNSSASWTNDSTAYNYYTTDSTIHTSIHNGTAANGNNYAGFSYSGLWNGTGSSASNLGSYGYYWFSSAYDRSSGYYLSFYSSYVRRRTATTSTAGTPYGAWLSLRLEIKLFRPSPARDLGHRAQNRFKAKFRVRPTSFKTSLIL